MRNKKLSFRKSFTLIETLVVVTIFSVIALGIGISFVSGMKLWNYVSSAGPNTDILITLEMISKDLHQSLNLPVIGFKGDPSCVSFPTLDGNSILKVTYRFDPNEKTLFRGYVDLRDIISDREKENYREKRILSLKDFSLSYLSYDTEKEAYLYQDSWMKEKEAFPAIKIQAKFKNEEFIKTIFIPIS